MKPDITLLPQLTNSLELDPLSCHLVLPKPPGHHLAVLGAGDGVRVNILGVMMQVRCRRVVVQQDVTFVESNSLCLLLSVQTLH
jgi:hypothetical protein